MGTAIGTFKAMQSQDRAGRARRGGGRGIRAASLGVLVVVATLLTGIGSAEAAISIGPATVTSAGESGSLSFTITRDGLGVGAVLASNATVDFAAVGESATSGTDFTATAGTATLTPGFGATTTTVNVPIRPDALNEDNETLRVELRNVSANETLGTAVAHGVITDDDPLPVATIGAPAAAAEGTGTAGPGLVFPVNLDQPSGRAVSVKYATSDGTATAGSDYTATAGTLVIPAGSTSGTVTVPVTPDAVDEGDETVSLTLSLPTSPVVALGAPATQTATGTITDDDTATITVTGASVLEGTSATPTATNAVVNLSTTSAQPVTVFYGTVAGTATEKSDYEPAVGQVTVPAGQRTAFIPLKIVADALPEPDETFSVTIGGPTGAAIAPGGATATITIRNDDTAVPGTSDVPGTTPGAGASPLPAVVPAAADAIRLGRPAYRRADATMRFVVQCPPSAGRCRGTVTVFSVPVHRSKVKALRAEQQLGSKRFDINAGGTLTVAVRLSTKAKGWLKTARSLPIAAYAVCSSTQAGISTARVKGTLHR